MSPQKKGLVRPADIERMQREVELRPVAELELADVVVTAHAPPRWLDPRGVRGVRSVRGDRDAVAAGQGPPSHDDWALPARERREQLYAALP
jgi:hypothetical protein